MLNRLMLSFLLMSTSICNGAMVINDTTLFHLNESRIEEQKQKIARDFKIRAVLAKGTFAVTAGTLAYLAYQWGLFDYFLPKKLSSDKEISLPEIVDPAKTMEYLATVVAYLKSNQAVLHDRLQTIESKNESTSENIFVRGAKYIGWTGVSIAGSLIVHYKWQRFFDYALATPSFNWFFSNHSILTTIDGLKNNLKLLTSVQTLPDYSLSYHEQATKPALESIVRNVEDLIAFTDYYLQTFDQDIVYAQNMDSVSRYLFNTSNDFLEKIQAILEDPKQSSGAIALLDAYKSDLNAWINRCALFEKEFGDL